ncbi:MAG: beta-hydroxyacyl-ACP dehydratase [Planctomycetota bacterium]
MRFSQIDHISLLEPGKRIEAYKKVTGKEDFLRDHFPRFAVLPGVLMLESLYQAANFLVRATENHECGLVVLRAAKNVKFADFLQPGQTLYVTAEIFKQDGPKYTLKATGKKDESTAVSGRLVVEVVKDDQPEIVAKHAALYMKQLSEQLQQAPMACS